jgi:hypothetical protein
VEHELILLLHLVGFGLLATTAAAGFILNLQYRKAGEVREKAVLLRAMKPVGLLSPIAMLIMLLTGIGNMHEIGAGLLTLGWLTAKIIFFAIAAISGVLFGLKSRKRGALVEQMAAGNAPPEAAQLLKGLDRQVALFYLVMPVLLLIILYLTVIGRLGAQ